MADDFWKVRHGFSFHGETAPANPVDGDFYFDVVQGFLGYNYGSWGPIGGTGVINYDTNPSLGSTAGYALYNNGAVSQPTTGSGGVVTNLTLTSTSTSPIVGHTMGILSKVAANAQGEGFSYDFTSDLAFSPGMLKVSFQYQASANFQLSTGLPGSNSDIEMWIYDKTNNVLIPLTPYVFTSGVVTPSTYTGYFQTNANSTSYRLIWHIATTNALAWTFDVTNVVITPQFDAQAALPAPVFMRASSSNQNVGSGGVLNFSNVLYDTNSSYNPSTGVYTAPYSGYYIAGASCQTITGGQTSITALHVNGGAPNGGSIFFQDDSGRSGDIGAGSVIIQLNQGDQVTWVSEAGATTTFDTNSNIWIGSVSLNSNQAVPIGINSPVKSNTSFAFSTASSTTVPVLDQSSNPLECVITTAGQPVKISLEPDGSANPAILQATGTSGDEAYGVIEFYRDGVLIATQQAIGQQNNISVHYTGVGPACCTFTDTPPPGLHTYTVNAYYNSSSPSTFAVSNCVLVAQVIQGLNPSVIPASLVSRIVKSNTTGIFTLASGDVLAPVTDGTNPLQAVVVCNGGDVEVGLQDDGSGNGGNIRINGSGGTGNLALCNVAFYRDGVQISQSLFFSQNNSTLQNEATSPATFRFIDTPPVGTHTYTVQASSNDGGSIQYTRLYARPLA